MTAAEAFLLQLTKKGLEGCSASARASLAAIEAARSNRAHTQNELQIVRIVFRTFGLCSVAEDLGIAVLLNKSSKDNARLELKPWIVEAALKRMPANHFTIEQQRTVVASTRTPEKVQWPVWWAVRG